MAVSVVTVTEGQKADILAKSEGHFIDMKAKEISPAKLTQTLSAFANADAGECYIGIRQGPNNEFIWNGFENQEEANAHLQVIDNLFPIGQVSRCTFLSLGGEADLVLYCEIDKTPDIRACSSGNYYVRRGAQNLRQSTVEQIERLRLNKGIISYEDQTLQSSVNDISTSEAMNSFVKEIAPSLDPVSWLRKQRLVGAQDQCTVAGCLLFADEPQVFIPKASIKIYRYRTGDATGTRDTLVFNPRAIEGNAYNQIYNAVSSIKGLLEEIPILGKSGLQKIEYPSEAIHEVITNAVIHRDYSIKDDIHVRIFDNRIEVHSPGTLPGHVTVNNILDERASRNPKIVRLLNKFPNPPNKDVGEGLNTAFEAMKKLRLKEPVIVQGAHSVVVTLRHERLGSPDQLITDYLRSNGEINNSIARQLCSIGSENTVKRIFNKMAESGVIERIPGRAQSKTGYTRGPTFPKD